MPKPPHSSNPDPMAREVDRLLLGLAHLGAPSDRADRPPTPPAILSRARQIARANGLRYAYTGNVHD
ncbi:MAG TPA: hypothetical protein VFN40_07020, partial [Gemmatimonadales bacterium]|nr:hypothetical protein [Gemmatimonadales bacterium]